MGTAVRTGLPLFLALAASLAGGCGDTGSGPVGPATSSRIEHLVVIVQENISFDSYMGTWCTAPTGSNPTCTEGPGCCERAPDRDPGTGAAPILLDDAQHAAFDPIHLSACFDSEINGGRMDRFVAGAVCGSSPQNFAMADGATVPLYHEYARKGAMADRWFQSVTGASSANDMYLVRAAFVFPDNQFMPEGAIGDECALNKNAASWDDPTIGDLLADAGIGWSFYVEGYDHMVDSLAQGRCPAPDPACPFGIGVYPCVYDPSDIPFQYYPRFRDDPAYIKDYSRIAGDLAGGTLPPVAWVKALGFKTEHPGYGTTITAGMDFVRELVDSIAASPYASNTLVLVVYDESGGYFDHVAPPSNSTVDGKPYGPRTPAFAVGRFARKGTVSHVPMEHASIVRFIEWNWLGGKTGQLQTRDAVVNGIGSLLDPAETGTAVPE